MFIRIILGLTLIMVVELCLFVAFIMCFGLMPLVIWCTITGLTGLALTKWYGPEPWLQFKQALWEGNIPQESVLDKLMLLLAGVVLILPGLGTDLAGLLLILPVTRKLLLAMAPGQISRMMDKGDIRLFQWQSKEESSDESSGAVQ